MPAEDSSSITECSQFAMPPCKKSLVCPINTKQLGEYAQLYAQYQRYGTVPVRGRFVPAQGTDNGEEIAGKLEFWSSSAWPNKKDSSETQSDNFNIYLGSVDAKYRVNNGYVRTKRPLDSYFAFKYLKTMLIANAAIAFPMIAMGAPLAFILIVVGCIAAAITTYFLADLMLNRYKYSGYYSYAKDGYSKDPKNALIPEISKHTYLGSLPIMLRYAFGRTKARLKFFSTNKKHWAPPINSVDTETTEESHLLAHARR